MPNITFLIFLTIGAAIFNNYTIRIFRFFTGIINALYNRKK